MYFTFTGAIADGGGGGRHDLVVAGREYDRLVRMERDRVHVAGVALQSERAADRGQQFAISRPGVSEHAGEGRLPEPVVDRVQLVLHVAGLVPSTTPGQRLR